eukprot:9466250-Pyramimonas_sp.AAC.1
MGTRNTKHHVTSDVVAFLKQCVPLGVHTCVIHLGTSPSLHPPRRPCCPSPLVTVPTRCVVPPNTAHHHHHPSSPSGCVSLHCFAWLRFAASYYDLSCCCVALLVFDGIVASRGSSFMI